MILDESHLGYEFRFLVDDESEMGPSRRYFKERGTKTVTLSLPTVTD